MRAVEYLTPYLYIKGTLTEFKADMKNMTVLNDGSRTTKRDLICF